MSEELQPCPFCKSRAEHYSFNQRKHTVRCRYCLADCGEHDTPERAAFVWNTRPSEYILKAEVERLKSKLALVKEHLIVHRDHAIQSYRQDGKTFQVMNVFITQFCNGLLELINTDQKGGEYE